MSQNQRQASLFAAETFQNVYRSYKNVDFRAYDFYSLKNALIEYIKRNYPEDFNDYIESSEYIAVIELLAYLGTSISFRMDLNARENFIDTAERRESVVRLAQMINYQPKRNKPSNGILKVVGVETTETVYDSLGRNLSNTSVFWDDPNNPDCYDQYVTIMNAAFPAGSPFGKSVKKGMVGGISTDLYRINAVKNIQVAYPISLPVNGQQQQCDVCNVDFTSDGVFVERHPDPSSYFHIMYRNDGHGFSSTNTGFFVYFRQGRLNNYDFLYEFPVENISETLTTKNINEDDVYVQSIDNNGNVLSKWTKVSYSRGNESIVYNSIDKSDRDIFSITSGVDDTVTIQYSDGNFGNVPTGLMRVWARESANTVMVMRPDEINNINLRIPYVGQDSQTYYLRVVLSLEETVNNATVSESNDDIKKRAPQGYYTQDRMVNPKDYNTFPLTIGNEILKVNTINRTHSGHSRYISINDPTGFHQSMYITASDGAFYKDTQTPTLTANYDSETDDPRAFVIATIQNHLKNDELSNFFYDDYIENYRLYMSETANLSPEYIKTNVFAVVPVVSWNTISDTDIDNVGYLVIYDEETMEKIKRVIDPSFSERDYGYDKFIEAGSVLKFASDKISKNYLSATVMSMEEAYDVNENKFTKIFFNVNIPNGWVMVEAYPAFRTTFTDQEISAIVAELTNTSNFSLMYIFDDTTTVNLALGWNVVASTGVENFSFGDENSLWLATATYTSSNDTQYTFETRGTRYVFESESDVRFYVDQDQQKKYASDLVIAKLDEIVISETNPQTKNKVEEWVLTTVDGGEKWVFAADVSITYDKEYVNLGSRNYTAENVTAIVEVPDSASTVTCIVKNGIITFVGNPTIGCVLRVELKGNSEKLEKNYSLNIVKSFYETSGYLNSAKVEVIPADLNNDGIPDDPYIFNEMIDKNDIVFFENTVDENGFSVNRLWTSNWYDLRSDGVGDMDWTAFGTTDLFLIMSEDRDVLQYEMNYAMLYDLLTSEQYDADEETMTVMVSGYLSYLFIQNEDEYGAFMSGDFESITGNKGGFDDIVLSVVTEYRKPTSYLRMEEIANNIFTLSYNVEVKNVVLTNSLVKLNNVLLSEGVSIVYSANDSLITVTLDEEIYGDELGAALVEVDIAIRQSPENVAFNYLSSIDSYSMFTYANDETHSAAKGRSYTQNKKSVFQYPFDYKWRHFSTDDNRIDPSVSNIMDMLVLTNSYYDSMKKWKRERKSIYEMPTPPTTEELRSNFSSLTKYKMMTDEIIFKSCSFKALFGQQAPIELRAKFKVIKVPNSLMTDNEIKTKVVELIDKYFDISEWDMGETFYFTELAAYIHKEMAGVIGTVILVPEHPESWFGSLFEVKVGQNELLMSTAQVSDILIVDSLTQNNMRA